MNELKDRGRTLSVCAFSFMFAYILSFLFEGKVLYSMLDIAGADASKYIFAAIIAHFFGQFSGGFFCKTAKNVKMIMLCGMSICFVMTVPFFFSISILWIICLIVAGYAGGCAVAAWGYFLKAYTPKNERIKSCADVLIFSNIVMIIVNIITINFSAVLGLILAMASLLIGMVFTYLIPASEDSISKEKKIKNTVDIRKPMCVLCLFVAVITVDSGLMYQVINPGFEHLSKLTSWYWAIPYIVALVLMRNLPVRMNRPLFLYVGMGMIMCAFIGFMLLGRSSADYIIVDTFMLGACGIFDLFWWSIIGETLDYSKNPALVFGIGLSANVFGVFCGALIGTGVMSAISQKIPSRPISKVFTQSIL